MLGALAVGVGLGLLVAAQVGPISLLLVRSTLRHGARVGLAVAAGAAIVDMSYAALGVAGMAPLLQIDAVRLAMGTVGAAVLVLIGGRAIWSALRVRTGGEADIEVARPARAFLTTVAATASNPLTIVSWAAVFASASVAGAVDGTADALLLVLGIGIGTALWKSALTALTVLAGRRLGERTIRTVDVVSGVGLIGFGSVLAWRTTVEA